MVIEELVASLGLEVDANTFRVAAELMAAARGGMMAIGVAAGAAAVGLAAAVAKTANYADGIEKAAQRTGIGVEALQALQYAAERADVGAGVLQASLNFMARRGVKDFEAELRRAADELAAMPDGGAKAARAMELFGKQGAELIPMLNEGSAGLDRMTAFAREAGIVLGEDMIESGASLKDALEELQGFIRGLAFTIAGPMLKPVREWLKAAGEWIRANRQLIAQRVDGVLTAVAGALKYAWQMLKPVATLVADLASNVWVLRTAAAALGFVLLSSLGSAAAGAASAVLTLAKGLSAVSVAGLGAMVVPALIGAALLALALVAEDVYQFLQGNDSLMGTLGVKYVQWLDRVLEIKPDDSPLMTGLKAILQIIFDIQGAFAKLEVSLRSSRLGAAVGGAMATANYVGYGLVAPVSDAAAKQRDENWRAMGYYGGLAFLDDRGKQGWGWNAAFDPIADASWNAPASPAAQGPTVTFEVVNVNAAPGTDGAKVAADFVAEVKRSIFGEIRSEYVTAATVAGSR